MPNAPGNFRLIGRFGVAHDLAQAGVARDGRDFVFGAAGLSEPPGQRSCAAHARRARFRAFKVRVNAVLSTATSVVLGRGREGKISGIQCSRPPAGKGARL
jgi:hypothetical protein